MKKSAAWENWVNLVLGAWLFITPWALASGMIFANAELFSWNCWIVGALVFASAILALLDLRPWEEVANIIFGVWMFLSPWLLGYSVQTALAWNSVIVGALITIFAGMALPIAQKLQYQHH
jgi:hypothetical protein